MLESLRSKVYGALTNKRGDGFAPLRLAKGAVLYANDVVGRPLASSEEFAEREAFEKSRGQVSETAREQAPVVVFHIERLPNELAKICTILDGEGIVYTVRAIGDDEAALSAAKMDSKGARFPMVFVAGDYIGGADGLTQAMVSGELKKRVFG